MKRVILNLDEELVQAIDDEYKRLGLPSRNSFIEQVLRKRMGKPNVFETDDDITDV